MTNMQDPTDQINSSEKMHQIHAFSWIDLLILQDSMQSFDDYHIESVTHD